MLLRGATTAGSIRKRRQRRGFLWRISTTRPIRFLGDSSSGPRCDSNCELRTASCKQSPFCLTLEPVPHLRHHANVPRPALIDFELSPERTDVRVDRAARCRDLAPPHFARELFTRRGGALAAEKRYQQVELLGGKVDVSAVTANRPGGEVHLDRAEAQVRDIVVARRLRA